MANANCKPFSLGFLVGFLADLFYYLSFSQIVIDDTLKKV